MPVAKLSRKFYEKFGDELTDELVNCLNTIEATYRLELRDLFEAHFGRFEAKLESRFEGRFAAIDLRFAAMDLRFEAMERKLEQLRSEMHREIVTATRWNILMWIPITLAVVGLYFK